MCEQIPFKAFGWKLSLITERSQVGPSCKIHHSNILFHCMRYKCGHGHYYNDDRKLPEYFVTSRMVGDVVKIIEKEKIGADV